MTRFSFPRSHAFPGGRVTVETRDAEGPCEIAFGDGVTIIGAWRKEADALHLDVPAYRTARGTEVSGRGWRLTQGRDGTWRSHRTN